MIILVTIIILLVLVLAILRLEKYEISFVKSDIDGQKYLVRDLDDKQKAANMLATIKGKMFSLVHHLRANKNELYKDFRPYIDQLDEKIKNVVINESAIDSSYTSYSVNKGEQIVYCLRSKKDNRLHDINLVMYVVLHEMAHVACPEYGHGELFKKIFAFLVGVAIDVGIYNKIDFDKTSAEYCGLTISESII